MGPSTTSSLLPSVNPMLLFVFLFPTSTTLRVLVKLFAEPSNREPFDLVTRLDLSHLTSRERRFSPSNSTRRFLNLLDLVTPLVFPSRVLPRTKRSTLVTSSTTKRMENLSPSSLSPLWLPSRNTLGPQAWILPCCLLSYRQGCLQDDQDLVEDGKEDRRCQGRQPSRALPIRKRRG